MNYYLWHQLDEAADPSAPNYKVARSSTYNTISHEWGHNITFCEVAPYQNGACYGTLPAGECLPESIASMYGSFLGVKKVGGSDQTWTATCGGSSFVQSPWNDQRNWLTKAGCARIPYSQRSRFDWFDCSNQTWGATCTSDSQCPPYQLCLDSGGGVLKCTNAPDSHNNAEIWNRFVRVLAECDFSLS